MAFLAKRQLAKVNELMGEDRLDEAKEALESLLPSLRKSSGSATTEQAKTLFAELADRFSENDEDLEAASCFESVFQLSTSSREQAQLLNSSATSYGFAEEYDSAIRCGEAVVGILGDAISKHNLFPDIYHRLGRWCRLAGRARMADCIEWYRLFLEQTGDGERSRLLGRLAHEDIADSLVDFSGVSGGATVQVEGMGSFSFKSGNRYLDAIKHYRRALELTDGEDVEGKLRLYSAITNCYFFEVSSLTIQLNDLPEHQRNLKSMKPIIDLLLEAVGHKEDEIDFKSSIGNLVSDDDLLDLAMLTGEATFYTSQFGFKLQREMPFPKLLACMLSGKHPAHVSAMTGSVYGGIDNVSAEQLGYTNISLEMADKAMAIWDALFERHAPRFVPQYGESAENKVDQETKWILDWRSKYKAETMRALAKRGEIVREGTALPSHILGHFQAFDSAYRAKRIGKRNWTDVDIEIYPLLLSESISRSGPDSSEAQNHRNSLGWAWFRRGDYVKALFYFESQFRIEIRKTGIDGFEDEYLLKAMLRALARLGRYREAIEFAVLRIQMNGWDPETTSYLAMLLIEVGEKQTSRVLVERLLKTTDKAGSWPELLFYLATQIDPVKAEAMATSILSGNEDLPGLILQSPAKHATPYLACLGCASYVKGRYEDALAYYEAALSLTADECGYGHYDLGNIYLHLLSIAMIVGADAVPNVVDYIDHALEFVEEQSALAFEIVDEELRYNYLEVARHIISLCNSLAVDNPSLFTGSRISTWLATFSNICNSATYYQSRFSSKGEKGYKQGYRLWLDARRREAANHCGYLLDSYTSEVGNDRFDAESGLIHCLTAGVNRFRDHVEERSRMEVPLGTAILEFGSFFYTDGYYADGGSIRNTAGMAPRSGFPYANHYYVSVRTGSSAKVVYLHECGAIDDCVQGLRESIADGNPVYEDVDSLRTRLIAPILPFIGDAKKLKIVPEGALCTLPFELLQRDESSSPFDLASISYLFSIDQQDLDFQGQRYPSAVVFSNPSFALDRNVADLVAEESPPPAYTPKRDIGGLISTANIDSLPWTEAEAAIIRETLSNGGTTVEVFENERACKGSFAAKRSAITHVATHGFAFHKIEVDDEAQSKKWSEYCTIRRDEDSERMHPEIDRETFMEDDATSPFQHAADPMMRCGLILSGAFDSLRGLATPDYIGDGIVTGSEILTMDFSEVELAVLASCKSALGETRNGEGVQGLRKAFDVAGVGRLICALWDVDDFSSGVFMGLFYERLASGRHNAAESLQLAKNAIRALSYEESLEYVERLYEEGLELLALRAEAWLRSARSRDSARPPFEDPYHWAGYVCIERLGCHSAEYEIG